MKKRRKKKVEKPIEMEHPNLRTGDVYIDYEISGEQLRKMFGLDDTWALRQVRGNGRETLWGTIEGVKGARIQFSRQVTGPVRAMEILSGAKDGEVES